LSFFPGDGKTFCKNPQKVLTQKFGIPAMSMFLSDFFPLELIFFGDSRFPPYYSSLPFFSAGVILINFPEKRKEPHLLPWSPLGSLLQKKPLRTSGIAWFPSKPLSEFLLEDLFFS